MPRLLILPAILALTAYGSPAPTKPTATTAARESVRTTTADCQAKGEAYFREIESWPKLSNGRNASEVAAERCARTTGAFDGLS